MDSKGQTHYKRVSHFNSPCEAHELTFSCFRRKPFLSRDRTRQYLAEAVIEAKEKHGFQVWAYVFMPEHVHLLLWPTREAYSISKILGTIKLPVSKRALAYVRRNRPESLHLFATGHKCDAYRFWQAGPGYDRNVTNWETLKQIVDYIHNNPVRGGLVSAPEEWIWSSARAWRNMEDVPIPILMGWSPPANRSTDVPVPPRWCLPEASPLLVGVPPVWPSEAQPVFELPKQKFSPRPQAPASERPCLHSSASSGACNGGRERRSGSFADMRSQGGPWERVA